MDKLLSSQTLKAISSHFFQKLTGGSRAVVKTPKPDVLSAYEALSPQTGDHPFSSGTQRGDSPQRLLSLRGDVNKFRRTSII